MVLLMFIVPGAVLCAGAWVIRYRLARRSVHPFLALVLAVFVWGGGWLIGLVLAVELGQGEEALRLFFQSAVTALWPGVFCFWVLKREK